MIVYFVLGMSYLEIYVKSYLESYLYLLPNDLLSPIGNQSPCINKISIFLFNLIIYLGIRWKAICTRTSMTMNGKPGNSWPQIPLGCLQVYLDRYQLTM